MKLFLKKLPVLAVIFFTASASAQSIWMTAPAGNYLGIEILKPDVKGPQDYSFISSAIYLYGRISVSERVQLVADVPLAHGGFDFNGPFFNESISETTIGNPFIGFSFTPEHEKVNTTIGIRLPVTPNSKPFAASFGSIADIHRAEAFAPDLLTGVLHFSYRHTSPRNVIFRLLGGPVFWFDTGDVLGDDLEILLDYSAQIGFGNQRLTLLLGFNGRFGVTTEGDFGDRSFHHIAGTVTFHGNRLHPGIEIRIPVDNPVNDFYNVVFGLTMGVDLR